MKAWLVKDKDEFCAEIIFAETRGKAKSLAKYTDACWDSRFIDIEATREPLLDKYYKEGKWHLDWEDPEDKRLLVSICGFRCEYIDLGLCQICCANDCCEWYKEYEEESQLNELP